jgi:hypothetical protein
MPSRKKTKKNSRKKISTRKIPTQHKPFTKRKSTKSKKSTKKKTASKKITPYNPIQSLVEFEPKKNIQLEFFIHDNGGRPFYVQVHKTNKMKIYKAKYYPPDYIKDPTYQTLIWEGEFECIFPGFEKEYGMHGASCLVQLHGRKYMHLGEGIITFVSPEPILYFAANMGNNDVPYPIGWSEHLCFMFIELQYAKYDDLPLEQMWCYMNPKDTVQDPWHADIIVELFYRATEICPKNFVKKIKEKKWKKYPLSQVKVIAPRE